MADAYEKRSYGGRDVGFGKKPAIAVIDFQRGYIDEQYSMGGSPLVNGAVEHSSTLLKLARSKNVPVAACAMATSNSAAAFSAAAFSAAAFSASSFSLASFSTAASAASLSARAVLQDRNPRRRASSEDCRHRGATLSLANHLPRSAAYQPSPNVVSQRRTRAYDRRGTHANYRSHRQARSRRCGRRHEGAFAIYGSEYPEACRKLLGISFLRIFRLPLERL